MDNRMFSFHMEKRMAAKGLYIAHGFRRECRRCKRTHEAELCLIVLNASLEADLLANRLHRLTVELCKRLECKARTTDDSAFEPHQLNVTIQRILELLKCVEQRLQTQAGQVIPKLPAIESVPDHKEGIYKEEGHKALRKEPSSHR